MRGREKLGQEIATSWVAIGIIFLFVSLCSCAPRTDEGADYADPLQLLEEYEAAVNAGHADRIVNLYAEDAVWMPASSPAVVGKEPIRHRAESALAQISLEKTFEVHEIIVAGEWAFLRATSKGTVTIKSTGESMPENHDDLFILRRRHNGNWKIARYIYNSNLGKE